MIALLLLPPLWFALSTAAEWSWMAYLWRNDAENEGSNEGRRGVAAENTENQAHGILRALHIKHITQQENEELQQENEQLQQDQGRLMGLLATKDAEKEQQRQEMERLLAEKEAGTQDLLALLNELQIQTAHTG
jgi:hypothetical protein